MQTVDIDRVSKRRIVSEFTRMQTMAQKYMTLSLIVAAELYRYDPEAEPFMNGTFTLDSVNRVRQHCEDRYVCQWHGLWLFRLLRWLVQKVTPRRCKG